MKYECKDFIGFFENVYSDGFCTHLIDEFERNANEWGINRQQQENAPTHMKKDLQIYLNGNNVNFKKYEKGDTYNIFWKGVQECFDRYCEDFSELKQRKISCNCMKMQKTGSGEGYHLWHSEQAEGAGNNTRVAVYMLYLNTLPNEACGETEFLYQQRRISTKENSMVIWPAAYTHMHRGNAVYGNNSKYIVTGWFNCE